jgi:hypothetical protein
VEVWKQQEDPALNPKKAQQTCLRHLMWALQKVTPRGRLVGTESEAGGVGRVEVGDGPTLDLLVPEIVA